MAARQRNIATDVMVDLGEAIIAEIRAKTDDRHVADRIVLRHAMAQINGYLAEQTIPASLKRTPPTVQSAITRPEFPGIR